MDSNNENDLIKEEQKKINDNYQNSLSNYDYLFDDLTSFLNQKFFSTNATLLTLSMIKGMIFNQNNNSEEKTFSVLVCDIDGLKLINDTLGHSTGDKGIKEIANIIKKSIRMTRKDIVDTLLINNNLINNVAIRTGGDEFLIILPNCTKDVAINKVAKRITSNIEKNLHNTKNLSLSIGAADTMELEIPTELSDDNVETFFTSLIRIAEERMYEEKRKIKKEASSIEKNKYVMKELLRLSDGLGLDINDDSDYTELKQALDKARSTIKKTRQCLAMEKEKSLKKKGT